MTERDTLLSTVVGLPDVFLPYQQELWRAIDANRVVVVEKSRRTGYSWALAAIAAAQAAKAPSARGSDVLYMGYERDMTREFIDYVADWAKAMQAAAGEVEEFVFTDPDHPDSDIKAFRIKFASGYEVIALPSVARALRGKQGMVLLDEAAFMDDLEQVLKASLALLMWGGKVVICSTHNGETNPFNLLINEIRAGGKPYYLLRLTLDEALAQGLYRRICYTRGEVWSEAAQVAWRAEIIALYGDAADEELLVIPSPTSGTYIPGPLIELRQRAGIPVLRLERDATFTLWPEHMRRADIADWIGEHLAPVLAKLDPATPHAFGFDFARKGDLSVLMPLAIMRDLVRRVPFTLEMRNVPFGQQRQVLWYIVERLPRLRAGKMDAGGNGSQIAEETMQRFGAIIEPVMMTEPWYREHMPAFKAAFEDGTIEIPRDRDIGDDIRTLKLIRGVARVPPARRDDDGKRRHGDAAIAGVLAIAASRAEPEVYEYESARPRSGAAASDGWRDRVPEHEDDDRLPQRSILPPLRGGLAW
jgi:phage FluMu gp28-like protein